VTTAGRLSGQNYSRDRRRNFMPIYYSGAFAAMRKAFSIFYHLD
jgi:hypothetical protein